MLSDELSIITIRGSHSKGLNCLVIVIQPYKYPKVVDLNTDLLNNNEPRTDVSLIAV